MAQFQSKARPIFSAMGFERFMFLGEKYTNRMPAAVRSSTVLRTSGLMGTEEAAMPRKTCCLSEDHNCFTARLRRWLCRGGI